MNLNEIKTDAPEPMEAQTGARVEIPWEEIDKWIATLSFAGDEEQGSVKPRLELDPGDRRN